MSYHSQKDVDSAIACGIKYGWRWVKKGKGHTVGYLCCTTGTCGKHQLVECFIAVFGTPKNPTNHAKKIRKAIDERSC